MGFAQLQSRLGIQLGPEAVMISTPLDKYEGDVYELADCLAGENRPGLFEKEVKVDIRYYSKKSKG